MAIGAQYGSVLGASITACGISSVGGVTTFAMATLNRGMAFRFTANDTRDVKTVYIYLSSVSAAGVITLTIETIDATTGKPSGSLYDAAATKAFTPVAGWNTVTFDTLPTTGLTAGNEYAVMLLTTTGGTTMTVSSYSANTSASRFPIAALTATDGTTRSNLAEVAASIPCCSIVFDDDVEEMVGFTPYPVVTNRLVYSTIAFGFKFTTPTDATPTVRGVELMLRRVGTPAGNVRIRIFSGSSAVSGTTRTVDADSLTMPTAGRMHYFEFSAPVTLSAATDYRCVIDSASSANTSNCWRIDSLPARSSATVPTNCCLTTTADVSAGSISWTDTATEICPGRLVLDGLAGTGGGGGGTVVLPGRGFGYNGMAVH